MADLDISRVRTLQNLLKSATLAANEMGISRGTLLLMLAVGALSAEDFDEEQIKLGVDFINAGMSAQMADLDFQS